jgi:hypothetical protein
LEGSGEVSMEDIANQREYTFCVWGVSKITGQNWLLWRCANEDDAFRLSYMERRRIMSENLDVEVCFADFNSYEMSDEFLFRDREEWSGIVSNPSLAGVVFE